MKKSTCIFILLLCCFFTASAQETFTLSSNDLGGSFTKKNEFKGFGCDGDNSSPQLSWKNAPQGTKSYAITCYDPDAPTGSGWWHWVAFDIPANTKELLAKAGDVTTNFMPKGTIQSMTSFGANGFGGPCPPKGHGIHTYIFTVYALKTDKLGLEATANPELVGYYLWQNTLAKATIVAYYQR